MKRYLTVLLFFASACTAPPIYTNGVPHLLQVEGVANLYRSGQPLDEAAVRYLAESLKVQWVWKLNRWDEGDSDQWFEKYGVRVDYHPIPPTTKPHSIDDYEDTLEGPEEDQWVQMESSVHQVWSHPEIVFLVHCVNGNDRTGAFSGLATLRDKTPQQAYNYILGTGFHWQLLGLRDGWWRHAQAIHNSLAGNSQSSSLCSKENPWFLGCRAYMNLCSNSGVCPP